MVANGGKFCPKEAGYCVKSNGKDQNSGVVKLNSIDGNRQNAQVYIHTNLNTYCVLSYPELWEG